MWTLPRLIIDSRLILTLEVAYMRILFVALLLVGCATTIEECLEGLAASRNPICIRECTKTYSMCIKDAAIAADYMTSSGVMRGCRGALKICASTCPERGP